MKEGAWTIFASGAKAAFKRAQPILGVFTKKVPYVGAYGNGTRMKFSANHMVAILNVATAEAITFGAQDGTGPAAGVGTVCGEPGDRQRRIQVARQAHGRRQIPARTMKVEVWQKDMRVIGEMAQAVDCPTPLFSACEPIYNAAMARGLSQSDTASVCEVLGAMAGIKSKRRNRKE